jgi:hypothetical protein
MKRGSRSEASIDNRIVISAECSFFPIRKLLKFYFQSFLLGVPVRVDGFSWYVGLRVV